MYFFAAFSFFSLAQLNEGDKKGTLVLKERAQTFVSPLS
jgi:hypothetical protein